MNDEKDSPAATEKPQSPAVVKAAADTKAKPKRSAPVEKPVETPAKPAVEIQKKPDVEIKKPAVEKDFVDKAFSVFGWGD